ncbi:hypothetical protein CHGG_00780 [Chaetomium globosum CBS 148.51]|uniref:Pre-mRNA splicing factor CLF1 n=1 Tax=Chaetomium globosum (strain ATCC 6205 / CBS 148.51 / DSM 1962 / NBRC 6347 / NRRL 1970) TaxID=306901 RepID=Q2HG74_CHAGB|nr:uncharacterized protein CHGG_00780 [Chaetomium globosum CBS 148.51]EAQ92545.1 hypothetical protein CHGG_00780 [Chaetomium globosum CBS 148.51]
MPLPKPKTPLNNACSVIFNNTLYTYSADAFQSLRLVPGAKWKVLPQGEKVKGAACVGSTTGTASTSAFFVVGGVGGTDEYQGLQKFTYETGQWESVKLLDKVTHQRVGHSAVYLNSTDSILVYAGNQDGSNGPSTSTFTIGASAPHEVRSYDTSGPPSVNPILLSWSPSEAALIGGSTWNAQVMLFNAADKKWVDSGASLAAPLPKDTSAIQAVLMTGDDGSKNLLTFDMSESPNMVKRTVLFKGPGVPVQKAAPVRRRASRRSEHGLSGKEKRAGEPLTINNWPAYNSTSAPKVTRSNFCSLLRAPTALVVIAGGNRPPTMFYACSMPETTVGRDAESKLSPVSATNPTVATQTPTEAAAAAVTDGSDPQLNTILGAVLGSIFGAAILLVLAVRRASSAATSNKAPRAPSHRWRSSWARAGEKSAATGLGRKSSNESRRDSSDSTFKAFKSTISKPMAQPTPPPAAARPPPPSQQTRDEKGVAFATRTVDAKPRTLTAGADKQGDTRRSSGWNRYWSGGSALNLLGFGNGNNNSNSNNINPNNVAAHNSRRTTLASDRSSNYSNPHRMTQDSATVPPLFPASAEPRMSFSRVNAHSPTIAVYNDKLNQGMSGRIETQRPVSAVSDMSASAYSSGIPESVQDAWDAAAAGKPWGADRSLNDSSTGVYSTPLAPASQGLKPPSQGPPRRNQPPVRDDMSWLNLGGN